MDQDRILDVDFAAMWQEQSRASSFGPRTTGDWDQRAARRDRGLRESDYDRAFLERLDLAGAQTLLDVGCGTGNLAIPLAKRLRKVHALDFSPEMLRRLERNARRAGVDNVKVHRLAWTDSWRAVPTVDVAICSRALGVEDLRAALAKLSRKARLRCMATIHAGGSYLGNDVLSLLDRSVVPRPGYVYAVNLLYQLGYRAKVDFIRSTGGMDYASETEFLEAVRWRIGQLSGKEEARIRAFYGGLPREAYGTVRYRHDFDWAVLSWDTAPPPIGPIKIFRRSWIPQTSSESERLPAPRRQ
jgi:SAM-dependent methyltransferase